MKYSRVRAGLEKRQSEYNNLMSKVKDSSAFKKPGSLNKKKTGGRGSDSAYSHRSKARKRSQEAVNSR